MRNDKEIRRHPQYLDIFGMMWPIGFPSVHPCGSEAVLEMSVLKESTCFGRSRLFYRQFSEVHLGALGLPKACLYVHTVLSLGYV